MQPRAPFGGPGLPAHHMLEAAVCRRRLEFYLYSVHRVMAHRAADARLHDAQAQACAAVSGPVELHRELHAHLLDGEPPVAARAVPLRLCQFRADRVNGLSKTDRFWLIT